MSEDEQTKTSGKGTEKEYIDYRVSSIVLRRSMSFH
jgi:hypothetical protein